MARKKLEVIAVDGEESEPRTRPVRVHETRSYIEEQPVEDVIVEGAEDSFPDPFAMFNEIITTNQEASMRIWRLPNYEVDGRASSASEREYCGSVPYEADNAALLDQVQQRVPMGGTIQLELYANGRIQKRGLLKLMKQAIPISQPYNGQQGARFVINQPPPAQQALTASPMAAMKEQAESFLAVANVIKQLQPEHVPQQQVEAAEPSSLKDRILENVILTAFKGDSIPADRFDRVLEVLGGGKPESSWLDSLMSGLAPHAGPLLQSIGPGVNALLLRLATGAPVPVPEPQPIVATTTGVLPETPATDVPTMDPVEYEWRRTVGRVLEDLFAHLQALSRGGMGINVRSSAEAILDLGERFTSNEQITGIITTLLEQLPEQVIVACAMIVPEQARERVAALAQSPSALAWITELQTETKAILAESAEPIDVDEGGRDGREGKSAE